MQKTETDISIVIPVYFNEGSIYKTFELIYEKVVQKNKDKKFEFLIIDDGSKDKSYDEIKSILDKTEVSLKVIKFTRNFGQVAAIYCGYSHSTGKCVINISADLQDPPELINDMIAAFFNENVPIVIAARKDREESLFRKTTSSLFYKTMKSISFPDMPVGGFDYVLIGKQVVKILLNKNIANPFLQGEILSTGFPTKFLFYTRNKREVGKSRWTFGKKIKYLLDGVLGYSYLPLRIISLLGIFFFLAGILYSLFIIINYFYGNTPFKGWAPIVILILVLSGIQMLMLGIIGEYLWRVLAQVKNKEPYIIEELLNSEP